MMEIKTFYNKSKIGYSLEGRLSEDDKISH